MSPAKAVIPFTVNTGPSLLFLAFLWQPVYNILQLYVLAQATRLH